MPASISQCRESQPDDSTAATNEMLAYFIRILVHNAHFVNLTGCPINMNDHAAANDDVLDDTQ